MDLEETAPDAFPQQETAPPDHHPVETDVPLQTEGALPAAAFGTQTNNVRPAAAPATGQWSADIFGCDRDGQSCCLVACCPCVAFGRIAEIVDRGSPSCFASGAMYVISAYFVVHWMYAGFYRSKLRARYDLPEAPFPDLWVHALCHFCALCQEYRELENRGFNMEEGWNSNVGEEGQAVTTPPTAQQGMAR